MANGIQSLAGNFDTFLLMLTTQLKNQDPTTPLDSNEFTQQLVAFAGVQQQVEGNALLQKLVNGAQASQVSSAASFVGTTIKATGSQGALVNGEATFGYNLTSPANTVDVVITNSEGIRVFEGTGSGNAGENIVEWDGTSSLTGTRVPDGVYTITVTAKDSAGRTVPSTNFITGKVTSASISNGEVMLNIGLLQVPQSNVTSVTDLSGAAA